MSFLDKIKDTILAGDSTDVIKEAEEGEYVELGTREADPETNITVRPYVLSDFESIKPILEALRVGKTVALINIKPLKDKDLVELKRAINKLKKTCDAIDGDIAGFGEDWIATVPAFGRIHRIKKEEPIEEDPEKKVEEVTEYSADEPADDDVKIETY